MRVIYKKYLFIFIVGFLLCQGLNDVLTAQNVQIQATTLTRGRLWTSTYGLGTRTNAGILPIPFSYPGYYKANEDLTYFGTYNGVTAIWKIGGEKVIFHAKGDYSRLVEKVIQPFKLHKNYNFTGEGGLEAPEEYYAGMVELKPNHPDNPGQRLGRLRLRSKSMVWSVPDFDDFVIDEMSVTNMDDATITDFYYAYEATYYSNPNFVNDKEYEWDEELGIFMFYDDTSMPIEMNGAEVEYLLSPGNETGDRGNPGNIKQMGSIDFALKDPAIFAMKCINVTPNKNGESKVWFNIASRHQNAKGGNANEMANSHPLTPQHESCRTFDPTYDEALRQITEPQEQASWREMWEDASRPKDGSVDGNLYERSPAMIMSVGPYDLAPGDSVSWIVIRCFGEFSRNSTQKGGISVTRRFKERGIKELKNNWERALALIANNYRLPANSIPPPTCGLPPFASDEKNLQVSTWSRFDEAGIGHQGFELTWEAVHLNYTDPETGEDDFAGYLVYRSEVNITGPWEEIADIPKSALDSLVQGNQVVFRFEAEPTVPYRFGVTSYDTKKNESAMTAYNYFAKYTSPPVGDDLSVIKVIPNPFRQRSGLLSRPQYNRISFVNVPPQCTIRIYTLAGDLVKTIDHDGLTEATWGSAEDSNYMLTDSYENVAAGLYIFHVESKAEDTKGQTFIGKFMIIK